jgi:8-oxo-dGTP pyrophosphatase MutT (NUDIX family)
MENKINDEPKKNLSNNICCTNCGKKGHYFKFCNEPITSYGVILVRIDKSIFESSDNHIIKTSKFMNDIQYLMISRKNSLGYIDFIRGKYKSDNEENVRYLIQQMLPQEIEKIKTQSFDLLWNEFWMDKFNKKYVLDEYKMSVEKYNRIVKEMPNIINETKALYNIPEWGFPKGRRNNNESSLESALREFYEETGFAPSDILLIDNAKPFIENFVGTNGVKYRHIYYLAEATTNKEPEIVLESQKYEVGNISFMHYNDAVNIIREYHIAKKNIVKNVLVYYLNSILTY